MDTIIEETTVRSSTDRSPYILVYQTLDFILGVISAILMLRFVLLMAAANRSAGFVQFIYSVSDVLMAPFRFIFPVTSSGGAVIDWSILVALVVYALAFAVLKQVVVLVFTADKTTS